MGKIVFYFICITIAFVVKGLAGFGDPLISTPLLFLALPNSVITPGLAPVSLILNANVVWKNRAHFSAKVVLPIAAFVLLGIIPGTLLLKFGSPQGLKLALGLLIIGLGVEMLTRKPGAGAKPNVYVRAAASFFSGLTAGLFGINLLFLAYMERVAVNREEFRANACFVFLLDNVFRMILLLAEGLYGPESLLLSITALPAAEIRLETLKVIHSRGFGHVGGSMDLADLMAVLYGEVMKVDPKNPCWADRDWLVLSKGHAGPVAYATFGLMGFYPMEDAYTLNQPGTKFPYFIDNNGYQLDGKTGDILAYGDMAKKSPASASMSRRSTATT